MVNVTRPLPVPLDGEMLVIHASVVEAAQAHPVAVATSTNDVLCIAGAVTLVGVTANEHAAAACVTVIVWPATVKVPVRAWVSVLAPTAIETVPDPVPLAALDIVIHDAFEATVHTHPAVVVTPTVNGPPTLPGDSVVGETV
jgi:hypothetical protein